MRCKNVKIRKLINLDHNILWELKVARMIVQVYTLCLLWLFTSLWKDARCACVVVGSTWYRPQKLCFAKVLRQYK